MSSARVALHATSQRHAVAVVVDLVAANRAREARALAAALDHPRRNGLLMMVAGCMLEVTTFGMILVAGEYFPAAIPVGTAIACLGAWLVVMPVPAGAKAMILGESKDGGRGWVAWELGAGAAILIGGAVGIAALLEISMP